MFLLVFIHIQLYKLYQQWLGFNYSVLEFSSTFPIYI